MILLDSSVWIEHLHGRKPEVAVVLEGGLAITHPFVIGELSCGNLRAREQMLAMLAELPRSTCVGDDEALALIERRALMGKGLSYVDVHLLASALVSDAVKLWTTDKRLAAVAAELEVGYSA